MKNDLSPSYLSSLVPQTVGEQSHYNLRNATDIQGIHARTALYYNSFLPSTLRDWNALTPDQQNAPSLASFKRLIRKVNRCPSYYYSGTRKWQIYHARLRTECALNQHLFRKNIVASPLCQCGLQETNTHYFLFCPRYNHIRQALFNSITPLANTTIKTILYGDLTKTDEANTIIFGAVQNYIRDSRRFH